MGHGTPEILTEDEAAQWVAAEPSRNMAAEPRQRQIVRALGALAELDDAFTVIAEQRAKDLLDDHTRVRAAGVGRGQTVGVRYSVKACLPVDVIGVYVSIPTPHL